MFFFENEQASPEIGPQIYSVNSYEQLHMILMNMFVQMFDVVNSILFLIRKLKVRIQNMLNSKMF